MCSCKKRQGGSFLKKKHLKIDDKRHKDKLQN